MREHIRERHDELTAQAERARLQYADLEEAIRIHQQELALLRRNLDAMHGGIQELDALLATIEPEAAPRTLEVMLARRAEGISG